VMLGFRRGLLLAGLDLLGLLFTLLVAFSGYRGLAEILAERTSLQTELAQPVAFFALIALGGALYTLVATAVVRVRRAARGLALPFGLSRWLGAAVGLGHGLIVATLVVIAITLLPVSASVADRANEGAVAPYFKRASSRLAPGVEELLPALPASPLVGVETVGPHETVALRFPKQLQLSVDPAAETEMLRLINRDRRTNGLQPLKMDEPLRQVARAHSREMFERSYFSHTSPSTGSPGDRLEKAGVPFLVAGENLAYQPNVRIAHEKLMASPGHRKNLLSPRFRRVGIGIISAGLYGNMYTQDFTD
ncbi:MAG: CAP domain-containing protein, partial [Chloroflexota bacterium]|nr:CAP domain-containing protein [Chloroflexota bacterium]